MKKKNDLILVNKKYLENKIYIIRGQKIMLDKDLAEIYGYSTSLFNRQVNRNKEKFDNDFMFKLTEQEAKSLRCQNGISKNKGRGGNRYASYAFTEKGIYMLMTILKGPLAIKQSIALIRLFDSMKKYIIENRELLTNNEIELRTSLLERDVKDINNHLDVVDNSLNKVMGYFEDKESYKHFLILNGKKLEADITYKNIFKLAKSSIIYIDNYIGLKTLELLSCSNKKVSITIFSDNKSKPSLTKSMIDDFNIQNIPLINLKENADISNISLQESLYNKQVIVIGTNKIKKLSINLATLEELCTLNGIGEKTAKLIIEYREEHNGFKYLEELMNIKGIGEKKFEKIKDSISL